MWSKINYNNIKRTKRLFVDKELVPDSDNPEQEYYPDFENINKSHEISFISKLSLNLFEKYLLLNLLSLSVIINLVKALQNPSSYEFLEFFEGDEIELICLFSEVNRNKINAKNTGKGKSYCSLDYIYRLISEYVLILFSTIEVIANISNLAYEEKRRD